MQLDVLIMKKNKSRKIRKNIGRNFRTYNLIEYKSPKDYLSIDDFYKVYGYTCFYKSDARRVNEIHTEEITITFVCHHYPQKLVKYLRVHARTVIKQSKGIYLISDSEFLIQLIVTSRLPEEENLWLRNLTDDLKENETAVKLIQEFGKHEKEESYQAVMNLIVKANEERFQEVDNMCEALEELLKEKIEAKERKAEQEGYSNGMKRGMAEGREQGIVEGRAEGRAEGEKHKLCSMIQKKVLKGKTVAQIAEELEETEETILPLYKLLMEETAEYKAERI